MEELGASDAVTLFVERAGEHDNAFVLTDAIAGTVASLCRHLDGIPLAVELAAARLGSMSIEHLAGRLDQRFKLLTGGKRNAVPRQQTLRAMIDWSYDLLTAPERQVLRLLSVFGGSFDLEAAESVCATSEEAGVAVIDELDSLVTKSLVVAKRSSANLRYQLLETVRRYGTERLAEDRDEAATARDAHACYYLALAEAAASELLGGPDQGRWLRRLDLEWDNLLAALAHLCAGPGHAADVLRLGVSLDPFLTSRGHDAVLAAMNAALDGDEVVPDRLRMQALLATAELELFLRGFGGSRTSLAAATVLATEALSLAEALADKDAVAEAHCLLSGAAHGEHDEVRATELAEQAMRVAARTGHPRIRARACQALARTVRGDSSTGLGRSYDLYREMLGLFREAGDLIGTMRALYYLALIELEDGRLRESRDHFEEVGVVAEELGDVWERPEQAIFYGYLLILGEDYVDAAQRYRRSLITLRQQGRRDSVAWAMFGLACCTGTADAAVLAQLHGAADVLLAEVIRVGSGRWSLSEERITRTVVGPAPPCAGRAGVPAPLPPRDGPQLRAGGQPGARTGGGVLSPARMATRPTGKLPAVHREDPGMSTTADVMAELALDPEALAAYLRVPDPVVGKDPKEPEPEPEPEPDMKYGVTTRAPRRPVTVGA